MRITAGTLLKYKEHRPLEILGKEPWFTEPVSICLVYGRYNYNSEHHSGKAGVQTEKQPFRHYEHFGSSHDVNLWLREQHIGIKDGALASHETLVIGDALVSLILEAEHAQARKVYIRSLSHTLSPIIISGSIPEENSHRQQIVATIYAALYK